MTRLLMYDLFAAYEGHPAITAEHRANADMLLSRVNTLLDRAVLAGINLRINPQTGSLISGQHNGGWRPPECPIGALNSAHKSGQAVDIYDPDGELDDWLMHDLQHLTLLGLYMEHPAATRGWCHLTTRAPRSGNRVFYP